MVSALPRHVSDSHIITLVLKQKMCYKHGRQERIRPAIVREAAKYLVQTDLFKELKITYDDNWEYDDEVDDDDDRTDNNKCTCELEELIDEPVNPGNAETLHDNEQDVVIIMAPGEGKYPLSLLYDDFL